MIHNIPVNEEDPMNGVIEYLKKANKLSKIIVSQSSVNKNMAIGLLNHDTSFQFASLPGFGQYIEIGFSNAKLYITGYGIMAYYNDDNIPRNWNISCIKEKGESIISQETNNQKLCPGKSGTARCGESDKKAFHAQNPQICSKIRYSTGADSNNEFYIVMSGFELFGLLITNECTRKNRINSYQLRSAIFIYVLFVTV